MPVRPDEVGRLAHGFVDAADVVALDTPRRNPVRLSPLADVGERLPVELAGIDRVHVVLAHEDHRQLLERGEVETFVERTLVHRAIPEEVRHERGLTLNLHTVRVSDGRRYPGTHNGRRSHDAGGDIDEVHGASLATDRKSTRL